MWTNRKSSLYIQDRQTGRQKLTEQCMACKIRVERTCQNCRGEYCIEHNEGCSSTLVCPLPASYLTMST